MLTHHGNIHHLFSRNFLKRQGLNRGKYNQVANFVYLQQEVNIRWMPARFSVELATKSPPTIAVRSEKSMRVSAVALTWTVGATINRNGHILRRNSRTF
jgi:hypothetical protein